MQRVLKVAESRCIEKAFNTAKEGRCHVCKSNVVRKQNYIALRHTLNHRLKKRYVKCLHFVGTEHSEVLCGSCKETEAELTSSTES